MTAAAAAAAARLVGSADLVSSAQGGTQAHVAHPIIGAHAQVDLLQQLGLLQCTAIISLVLAVPVLDDECSASLASALRFRCQ